MTPSIPSQRLISLDALRGFTVAGMILVNVPGSWEHIYAPFRHADFNGLTLADLVFTSPYRVIIGSLIIKHLCNLDDLETVAQISKNIYMPYFLS